MLILPKPKLLWEYVAPNGYCVKAEKRPHILYGNGDVLYQIWVSNNRHERQFLTEDAARQYFALLCSMWKQQGSSLFQ